ETPRPCAPPRTPRPEPPPGRGGDPPVPRRSTHDARGSPRDPAPPGGRLTAPGPAAMVGTPPSAKSPGSRSRNREKRAATQIEEAHWLATASRLSERSEATCPGPREQHRA